jgi:hypothetical protein
MSYFDFKLYTKIIVDLINKENEQIQQEIDNQKH